jgi:predicted RNase H-like nuclease (RuvC/YqgF family)
LDNKKVLVAVGIGAVILAIVFIIALVPDEPVVDPYVVELESEVANYTAQIDSMDNVVLGMNDRINAIRTQMDSSRASNKVLLGSLRKVTNEMKEYRRLYGEQKRANERLVNELKQVRAERDQSTVEVRTLKYEVDSLNTALYSKTVRLVRLESSLEQALDEKRMLSETATSVLVIQGTEDDLKQRGFLKTSRSFFRKNFRVESFPDVLEGDGRDDVMRISLGETLALTGELEALCDRHGKLEKGKEYEVSKGPPGQSLITFIDDTLQGQRILAVVKAGK